jgi:hypothetical protein
MSAKTDLIAEAQGMIFDTVEGANDVPEEVWNSAIKQALRDLSRYSSQLLPITIEIAANESAVDLPVGFIEVDIASFNRAINPKNLPFTWRSFVYVLQSQTSASSDLPSYFNRSPMGIEAQSSFRFCDGGANGKQLIVDPVPQAAQAIKCLYLAAHTLTEATEDEPNGALSVPDDKRDLLLLLMCRFACRALSRHLAGDKYLMKHYAEISEDFGRDYENRTRFAPVGIAG